MTVTRRFFSLTSIFDLLGDPISENWGKRGRPPQIPAESNHNKIRLLLALGWTNTRTVWALSITGATPSKYYFHHSVSGKRR